MYMYYVKQLEYCSKMQYTTSSTISSTHLNYCWYSWCTCESCAIIFSQWQVNFLQFHKSSLVIQENEILNFIFLEIFYLEIDMQWHKKKTLSFHQKTLSLSSFDDSMHILFFTGMFRKVANCALQIAREEEKEGFYSLRELNRQFLLLSMTMPTLTLQWCNILILLNYDDQSLWSDVMQTPNRHLKPGTRYRDSSIVYIWWKNGFKPSTKNLYFTITMFSG